MSISIRKPAVAILIIILLTTSICIIPYFTTPQYVNVKKTYAETIEDIKEQLGSSSTKKIDRLDVNGSLFEIDYL
ncbi:hypothetical protein C5S35_18290 [Candidatus Methanophagaceae archaeon]|nr:hypothetical protein C5S35_18290 [Methanophagales archaeon]